MPRQRGSVRRGISPESQEALHRRQASLTALTQHPSWPDLHEEVDRKQARMEETLLAKTLGTDNPVDLLWIAEARGFIKGMRYFVSVPETAEARLNEFLREIERSTT